MIAFNPDLIDVVIDDVTPAGRVDWSMSVPEQGPTAYIRIDPKLRDFFKKCNEAYGVIGFEYGFDEAGLNFGLVLKKETTNEST